MAGKKKKRDGQGEAPPVAPASSTAPPPADPSRPGGAEPSGTATPAGASRRRFLALAGAGAVAAGAAGVWVARQGSGRGGPHDGPHAEDAGPGERRWAPVPRPQQLVTFNPHQYDTLDAVAGVLLPADDEDPGARETGAMVFIDRAMSNPAFVAAARSMKVAVAAIDWQSNQAYGKKFIELELEQQDAVLQAVYQGEADRGSRFKGRTFVPMMLGLVLEGHLAEPVHGGNKDGIGWKLVGFEPVDPRPGRAGSHHH